MIQTQETRAPSSGLSKAQRAYQWLKQKISRQEFTPGYRLVLSTIAQQLDMSVVPVREAIRQLEAEGLVTFQRNVGAQVAMVDESRYRSSMETLGILEGAATALAAPNLGKEDLRRARELNDRLAASLDDFDPHAFTQTNHEFHQVLFARCPNERLTELVSAEWERLGHLRDSTFSFVPGRARESVEEHAHVLELIENGASSVEIERAARGHRQNTLTSYLKNKHSTTDSEDFTTNS
ncbi:GntR family transcriptional regulator [Rothia uropygialis]|uniref:GntR family transcriptional regulator n=1 Tax=Kocuria sp. 36 TaxID=1415402 RepID=UPI00101C4F1C|nr:GntR family transcriptional regulator [Kocuria sp. 36]